MSWPKALPDDEYNQRWIARVLANTERTETGCLVWKGYVHIARGYGQTPYRNRNVFVHRMLYQLTHGVELGRWQFVCHSCDVRLCTNIDHLWLGSPNDNNQDMVQKRRTKRHTITHCKQGHPMGDESRTGKRQWRACRVCQMIRLRLKAGWPDDLARAAPPGSKLARLQSIGDAEHG